MAFNLKNFFRILRFCIAITIIVFLYLYLRKDIPNILSNLQNINLMWLGVSVIFGILSYLLQGLNSHIILRGLGENVVLKDTLRAWFYSLMARYIPGKVFHLFNRVSWFIVNEKSISKKIVGVSYYYENLIGLILSLIFGGCYAVYMGLIKDQNNWWTLPIIITVLLIVSVFFLHPVIVSGVLNFILKIFKKEPVTVALNQKDTLLAFFIYSSSLIVYGISFYLFIYSIHPVKWYNIFIFLGIFSLYSILNLIAFFTPNGIGVGEFSLIFLLKQILPDDTAATVTVSIRLLIMIIELFSVFLIWLWDTIFLSKQNKRQ